MTISLLVEVDESLVDALREFLEQRPDYDQDRAFQAGLSLFLLQNKGGNRRESARIYLDTLFKRPQGLEL